ncbi:AMMECR1 domain-containing protein [Lineolata rhizophorae]|uniref:AMMECR1 domain-containing protein n=1 Tax=Lineolata rhizophorae TaxID=578093 RepID=A0A6A6P8B9_9PEZI|nr:AMMECR1 domain-containing protein [Lineolata rhizophorae]
MATQAHCAYCFETLASSLEKRPALSLREIEDLWEQYNGPSTDSDSAPELGLGGSSSRSSLFSFSRPSSSSTTPASSAVATETGSSGSGDGGSGGAAAGSKKRKHALASVMAAARAGAGVGGGAGAGAEGAAGEHPLFVTWNTVSARTGNKSLRGCIGTFEPHELEHGLRSYALTSAFDDTRFSPIGIRELPSLECGVTLLTDFRPIADPLGWTLGEHGLRINFTYHGRRYGSTYLPDVAKEQGWTKEETMVSLMRKAGWSGRRDEWRRVGDLSVITYKGKRADLDYLEWREWRDWVDKGAKVGE